jgi:hypothetical protein
MYYNHQHGDHSSLSSLVFSPFLSPSFQLWDHNPDLLHNRGVAEASYILLGSTVAASLAAGFVTLSALPDAEKKKK